MDLNSFVPERISTRAKFFLFAMALNGIGNGMINVVFMLYLISLARAHVIFALSSYLLLRNEEEIVVNSTVSVH